MDACSINKYILDTRYITNIIDYGKSSDRREVFKENLQNSLILSTITHCLTMQVYSDK